MPAVVVGCAPIVILESNSAAAPVTTTHHKYPAHALDLTTVTTLIAPMVATVIRRHLLRRRPMCVRAQQVSIT